MKIVHYNMRPGESLVSEGGTLRTVWNEELSKLMNPTPPKGAAKDPLAEIRREAAVEVRRESLALMKAIEGTRVPWKVASSLWSRHGFTEALRRITARSATSPAAGESLEFDEAAEEYWKQRAAEDLAKDQSA